MIRLFERLHRNQPEPYADTSYGLQESFRNERLRNIRRTSISRTKKHLPRYFLGRLLTMLPTLLADLHLRMRMLMKLNLFQTSFLRKSSSRCYRLLDENSFLLGRHPENVLDTCTILLCRFARNQFNDRTIGYR